MTCRTGNEGGRRARTGAQTVTLLSAHRNLLLLQALEEGRKRQIDLRAAVGNPAQTTLRAHLKALVAIGAIAKSRHNGFPGAIHYELLKPGSELLVVARALESWLAEAPGGPLKLHSDAARAAIRALADGWSSAMLRAIASRPVSLTELDRLIGDLNYPSLERRLTAMRLAGLVEALPANGRGTPYVATEWLRHGTAPLAAAAHWEHRHASGQAAPIARLDAEAGLLLAMPLVRLEEDFSGACRMAVEFRRAETRRLAGVTVEVEGGRVRSCTARLAGTPNAWVSGPTASWLAAIVGADVASLELGGDSNLASELVEGLRRMLFGGLRASANSASVNPRYCGSRKLGLD